MPVSASARACSCHFFLFTLLPCRHIFAVRKVNYFCAFDESVIDYTWNMKYYEHTLACLQDNLLIGIDNRIPQDSASRTILASHLFEIVVRLLLDSTREVFESRFDIMKKLIDAWKTGDDVSLKFDGVERNTAVEMTAQDMNLCAPGCSTTNSNAEDVPPPHGSSSSENQHLQHKNKKCQRVLRQGLSNFRTNILKGKHVNLAYLFCLICFTKEGCVEWLRRMGCLVSSRKCPSCGSEMTSKNFARVSDGVIWCCTKVRENKKTCSKRCSVRLGSWFELTNMTLEQILVFSYMWINGFTRSQIISETGISSSNFVLWDKFYRRVCEQSFKNLATSKSELDSCNHNNAVEKWLEKNAEEDKFVKFLKDCALTHQFDSAKNQQNTE